LLLDRSGFLLGLILLGTPQLPEIFAEMGEKSDPTINFSLSPSPFLTDSLVRR